MLRVSILKGVLPLLGLLALGNASSFATTFYMRPFPEVIADAPIVVRGQTGQSKAKWGKGEDGSERIFTFTELQIREVFKGQVEGSSLTFREMGGEVEGVGLQIAGTAHFQAGEDVVVLLGPQNKDGTYNLQGMAMGKLNLINEGGKELLVGAALGTGPEGDHVETLGQDDPGSLSSLRRNWSIADLKQLIAEQNPNKITPLPAPPAGISPAPSPIAGQAPPLQPNNSGFVTETSPDEPLSSGGMSKLILVLGGAGVLGGIGFFLRKYFLK